MGASIFYKTLIISCLVFSFAQSTPSFAAQETHPTHTPSNEESFLIRRIAEFWKDGDYEIVKTQILHFLDHYPDSHLKAYFLGILGDIHLQDNQYEEALEAYEHIEESATLDKIILNKLQCYYELNQFEALAREGAPLIKHSTKNIEERREELHFLMGEAFFRRALVEKDPAQRETLVKNARDYYSHLETGQYERVSQFALAQIHAILGDHQIAAQAYHNLAQKHSDMKEDLLFQAASAEAKQHPADAIDTFKQIKEMGAKRAPEAAFNVMILLLQTKAYAEVIESAKSISSHISKEHLPTFYFVVGKSHFALTNYKEAIDTLNNYIEREYIPSDQLKQALLIQMTAAYKTHDEPLLNKTFEKLDTLFPNDPELPKALFMHAMLLKEQGAMTRADEILNQIKEQYGHFEDEESFLFEYGFFAHQNKRWKQSYETFKTYVTNFSKSSRIDAAWKLFLSSALNLYKHSPQTKDEEGSYVTADFFADLQSISEHKNLFNEEETKDYTLLYAKTAYELNLFSEALRFLQNDIFTTEQEHSNPLVLAEAHFIAGLCHKKLDGDLSALCMHLEEALLLNPELYDSATTHLQLYNAYVSLTGLSDQDPHTAYTQNQSKLIDQAATHLHLALIRGEIEIKQENQFWLANHYYQKAKSYFDRHWTHQNSPPPQITSHIDQAIKLYTPLLFQQGMPITLNADNLFLEDATMQLAKLMQFQNQHQKKLLMIKHLLDQQNQKPELDWDSHNQALFELAITYEALGDDQKAFETFHFISTTPERFSAEIATTAILKSAHIHFQLLHHSLKGELNEEILSILNDLKALQIRKNVHSEPIHLEAALEYAYIRSKISKSSEQDTRYLFFLNRITDDFTSQEDLVTRDYLVDLNKNPKKKQVFESYLKHIEAEKLRIEAKQLYDQAQFNEAKKLHENALTLYNEIKNDPTIPQYLFERITQGIRDINTLNAYQD